MHLNCFAIVCGVLAGVCPQNHELPEYSVSAIRTQEKEAVLTDEGARKETGRRVNQKVGEVNNLMKDLYDQLYDDLGYHADLNLTHAEPLVDMLLRDVKNKPSTIHSVLDVGCSHGKGVQLMWEHSLVASGIDLATPAIAMARKHRPPPQEMCIDPCFEQAAAQQLPYADQSFDAILSSDVLEHVPTEDVPAVVKEFARVARQSLYLL